MSNYTPLKKKGNTSVIENQGLVVVRYHETDIMKHDKNAETIQLNNGGWLTDTTRRRINQYMSENNIDIQIVQKNFEWIVYSKGEKIPFENKMVINL